MRPAGRTTIYRIVLPVCLVLAASVAGDRILGALGFPSDWAPPVDHGPHHDERRRNLEFEYTFRTNSEGIRYRELPLEKTSPAEYRTLLLGDSYAEGFGVDAAQTVGARLEAALSTPSRQAEFINCGLTGTGPLQYGRIFLDVGVRYHPDAVLVMIHANDVSDTDPRAYQMVQRGVWFIPPDAERSMPRRAAHALWPHTYLLGRGVLERVQRSRPQDTERDLEHLARTKGVSDARIASWRTSLPPDLAALIGSDQFSWWMLGMGLVNPSHWTDSLDIDTDSARARWTAMAGVLSEIVRQARARQLPVAVVFAPVAFQFNPDYGDIWRQAGVHIRREWLTEDTQLERSLKQWAAGQEVPFLNLTPIFRDAIRAGRRDVNFRLDPHWTAEGHALAAAAIAPWLKSLNVNLQ